MKGLCQQIEASEKQYEQTDPPEVLCPHPKASQKHPDATNTEQILT